MISGVAPLTYPLHRFRLGNGLRVVVSPDHTTPVVAVNLWYNVGSAQEAAGQSGIAHLFEHLMFQGSRHVERSEHLALMQAQGAVVNATTSFDRTNYFETVPVGALDLALWLEADRLASLALTQANLDNQRDVVKEEKRQRYDNTPYGDVLEHVMTLAFPAEHPYGHTTIGSMADLDAASLASVQEFFATHYSPANCVLTLVGDVEPEDAVRRVERYFGSIPGGLERRRPVILPRPPLEDVPRTVTAADVPASTLYATWRLPARGTRDFDCVDLALDVLGGSETSRLPRRLVREAGLCASAGASALGLVSGNSVAFCHAQSLDERPLAEIEDALVAEIDRLATDGPTDEEVARTQIQFEREWLTRCAQLDARADLISAHESLFGDPDLINRRVAEVASLTATDVREACRRWLLPEQRGVVEYHVAPRTEGELA